MHRFVMLVRKSAEALRRAAALQLAVPERCRSHGLYKARSMLYRRQIVQENIRWKALDEIYKIYMLLHRSDLSISENFRQTSADFSVKFSKDLLFLNSFR